MVQVFGKHAQRHMVVEAMQGALTSNGIRSEAVNLMLPGYRNDGRNDCSKQR